MLAQEVVASAVSASSCSLSISMDVLEVAALKDPNFTQSDKEISPQSKRRQREETKHLRRGNRDVHLDLGNGLPGL